MSIISKTKSISTKKQKTGITEKLTRYCPKCSKAITYVSKYDFLRGMERNTWCKGCRAAERALRWKLDGTFDGENNPFYGKHHSAETKQKMSGIDRSWMTGSMNPMKNEEIQQHFSRLFSGEGNPMYGTHLSDERKREYSLRFSGKGNPMYGKPSPPGSGNGWANWYKGRHFRSLRELQYFINEIDEKGIVCESAQCKKFRIPYKDMNGIDRTYSPDFFVDGNVLVEIKPVKLWNTFTVKTKKMAAEAFCQKNGWVYKLIDVEPNSMLLKNKYLAGEIRLVEKYKTRFEKYIGVT